MYEQSLLASRARLAMAHALKDTDYAGAIAWARAALATFERIGAMHDADEAAQVLRELGVAGRVGPRQRELLTQRGAEVLSLVARGLTNREIAARLVISAKTVEHHVSQIFGKLRLHSRAEAAAFASSHAIDGPARTLMTK
jgi:DNA-binding NarL/FixJ family response regulator